MSENRDAGNEMLEMRIPHSKAAGRFGSYRLIVQQISFRSVHTCVRD